MLLNDWRLFALGSALFAAFTAITGKIGVSGVNSNVGTLVRTVVILVVTLVIISVRGEWQAAKGVGSRAFVFLVISGLATGLSWLCYFRALQLGPASKVAPVDKLSVVLVIVMAFLFLGEAITWKVAFGGLLVLAGTLVLAL